MNEDKYQVISKIPLKNFKDRYIEVRKFKTQIRYYEIDSETGKSWNIKKDTVKWLYKHKRINRSKENKLLLKI